MCLLHWQVDSLPLCHLGSPLLYLSTSDTCSVSPPTPRNYATQTGRPKQRKKINIAWRNSNSLRIKTSATDLKGVLGTWIPTQWTWVWVNSGSWRWTGMPGVLLAMGSQTVGHAWVTELNCTALTSVLFSLGCVNLVLRLKLEDRKNRWSSESKMGGLQSCTLGKSARF